MVKLESFLDVDGDGIHHDVELIIILLRLSQTAKSVLVALGNGGRAQLF